jgi:hypothetical protein
MKIDTITGPFMGDLLKTKVVDQELGVLSSSFFSKFSVSWKPAEWLLSESGSPGHRVG